MAQVDQDALTTFKSVRNAIMRSDKEDSLSEEVFQSNGQFEGEGKRAIHSASDRLREYLKRGVHVNKLNPVLVNDDWCYTKRTPDSDYPYRLRLSRVEDWPVVAVEEDVKLHPDRDRHIYAKKRHSRLNYWGGYRRGDQNLADLNLDNNSNFSDKKDIPSLDGTIIEDVVNNIAIYWATIKIRSLLASSSVTQDMGEFQSSLQRETFDKNFEMKQLKRIAGQRYLVG